MDLIIFYVNSFLNDAITLIENPISKIIIFIFFIRFLNKKRLLNNNDNADA